MKWLLLLVLTFTLSASTKSFADGFFVPPKFVWDKHKDINEPTQKAIIVFDAGQEDLILQVKYEGPTDEFGWLIPVPNQPKVQQGSMKCFYELSQYTQRHFESWGLPTGEHALTMSAADAKGTEEPPVKVVEIKTVGAYEIAVLSTKDSGALAQWLEKNQFYFPTNKTDVLDSYVKQQWYFVAVKIKLGGLTAILNGTTGKLASGELNPLRISFASDHCVFPLKISSINGKPSEVQLYVLSPEPLLEKTMLEQKLPLIYSNDMAQAASRAQMIRESEKQRAEITARHGGLGAPRDPQQEEELQKMAQTPEALPDELLHYAKVTKADLPYSAKLIPRLADNPWWLTKQTWTFQPEQMRDLSFEPAIPFFSEKLASKYGYFAVAGLSEFGADVVPTLVAALQNPNPTVRVNAASVWGRQMPTVSDSRLTEAAVGWLKDSEPEVRVTAVNVLTYDANWKPKYAGILVASLRDNDASVSHAIMVGLGRYPDDVTTYVPSIQKMLQDQDPHVRIVAMKMLFHLRVPVPREVMLSFLNVPDHEMLGIVATQLRYRDPKGRPGGYDISNDEAKPLFQNPDPLARMIGLIILYHNAKKQSVEMALPLLNDPEANIRMRAAGILRALTGQHFKADQPDQWQQWWMANKANFVVELHPEELRPQRNRAASNAAP